MIKDSKTAIKFMIIIMTGFVIVAIISGLIINHQFAKYEEITKSSYFKGRVESISKYKSAAIINSGNKEYIIYGSDNFDYSPPYLNEFIKQGDFLKKNRGSDSLYIYKNDVKYFFILGKTINRK